MLSPDLVLFLHFPVLSLGGRLPNGGPAHSSVEACFLTTPGGVKPPLGRKETTADADHCRTLKAVGSAEDSCCALDRLQWVRNGLTRSHRRRRGDDYNSKALRKRGGAGQDVSAIQKQARGPPGLTQQYHPESLYRV